MLKKAGDWLTLVGHVETVINIRNNIRSFPVSLAAQAGNVKVKRMCVVCLVYPPAIIDICNEPSFENGLHNCPVQMFS